MKIELYFQENLNEGIQFRIPIDSEADEFLSGLIKFSVLDGSLYIRTNCMAAEKNLIYRLDIIQLAMNEVYKQETGKNIFDER